MSLRDLMHESWMPYLEQEFDAPYFKELEEFLAEERANETIFPPEDQVFSAFTHTPYDNVRVLVLGQDPYHGAGQAHGLSFSVQPGIKTPPSLRNMYKELQSDLGFEIPNNGYLVPWAEQGVLMINAVFTVREANANSHKNKGWENFTDAVIRAVNEKETPVAFVLWGGYARKKAPLITNSHHLIHESGHPSPLSAKKGFFGTKPYSTINAFLAEKYGEEIDWQIPNL
ncbi:MAG: uracil-DNA glycosylase [Deltaproteobacteria bacterium]|nr:MAG: uracil-DNA glycosylase [Deltaproteobacteria bacterium]